LRVSRSAFPDRQLPQQRQPGTRNAERGTLRDARACDGDGGAGLLEQGLGIAVGHLDFRGAAPRDGGGQPLAQRRLDRSGDARVRLRAQAAFVEQRLGSVEQRVECTRRRCIRRAGGQPVAPRPCRALRLGDQLVRPRFRAATLVPALLQPRRQDERP
jgi:hypothetical protein